MDKPRLFLWVVYNSPLDYPGFFVARKWNTDNTPTDHVITHKHLPVVRDLVAEQIIDCGFSPTCLAASPNDDPKIIEIWF